MAKAKWQVEQEKREAIERELKALKERIPQVLSECIEEYGLHDQICVGGLQDFCERLGAADYQPVVKAGISITVENIDLPGEPNGLYAVIITDETLADDLSAAVNKFLGDRYPNAQWDTTEVAFDRA